MQEYSEISIKYPDMDTIDIVIESAEPEISSEETSQFGSSGLQAPGGDLLRSVFGIGAILRDERVWLQRFTYCKYQLRSRPRDAETSFIEVLKRQDETVKKAVVKKSELCQAILSAAKSYYERACPNGHSERMDPCDCTTLAVGIEDGQRRLDYYRKHGTQQGYTPSLSRDHLKTIVTECKHVDRLRQLIPQTDAVHSFVDDLAASDDDEYVEEWYDKLLLPADPEIPSEAAKALAENPDVRAKDALLQIRWNEQEAVVPHAIDALVQLGGDDVREALLDLPSFSKKEPIRKAAIEGLAAFDDEEVREALREIADDGTESDSIRETARDSLETLEE